MEQGKRGNEEENAADRYRAWPNKVECLSVAHGLGDGVDNDGQVATDVVHEEKEESNASCTNLRITDLGWSRKVVI